jgi:hypothetical protein
MRLPPDFKEFLRLLRSNGVEYLLIGGYAVGYHGYPRATNDIDVWIAVSKQNAERTVAALREFGFGTQGLSTAPFLNPKGLVRMGRPPLQIEIVTFVSGLEFDAAHRNRIEGQMDGVAISVLSLGDLKRNKEASGRLKDLADLEQLPKG